MLEQKFAFSLVVFCSHAAISLYFVFDFYSVFDFYFFSKWFSQSIHIPFLVYFSV